MASFPDLRLGSRLARAKSVAVRAFRSPRLLAVSAVLLLTAFFAVSELATLRGAKAHDASAYLTRELGSPLSSASLVRSPARGVSVSVRRNGYRVATPDAELSLTSSVPGRNWRNYAHGVQRLSSVGSETILIDGKSAEELLTVSRHHGRRTWRWRLDTKLQPRVTPKGYVGFFDGNRLSALGIDPVAIFDAQGHDVTPPGARWTTVRRGGHTWLELTLDDSHLETPYTIDPTISFRSAGTVATSASGTSISVGIPAGALVNDLLLMQVDVASTTIPSTPTGWTLVGLTNTANNSIAQAVFWRKAQSGDAGTNVSVTIPNAAAVGVASVYKGVDSSSPIQQTAASATANNKAVTCPGLTTTAANEMLVCAGTILTNGTWPASGGGWTREATGAQSTSISLGTYDQFVATSGTVIASNSFANVAAANARSIGNNFGLTVDTGAPVNGTIAIANVSPAGIAYLNGGTIYYRGSAAGVFQIRDPFTDAKSATESVNYPLVSSAGWTHANETPTTGPNFQSANYSWLSGTTTPPTAAERTITEKDAAGNTTTQVVPIVNDTTAPSGQTISLSGTAASPNYYKTNSVSFTLGDGSDGGSGVDTSTRTVTRETGTLSGDSCTGFSNDAGTFSSPDTAVSSGHCYRYTFTIKDNVGNTSTGVTVTAKVDGGNPSHGTLSISNVSPAGIAYANGSGTIYYRGSAAGQFKINDPATDSETAVASVNYPLVSSAGWTHASETVGTGPNFTSSLYQWSAGTTTPPTAAERTLTATDAATNTGTTTASIVNDTAAPSVTAPTVTAGYYTSASVAVTLNGGSDGGSGVASGSSVVQRDEATLAGGSCGSFPGSWTTITLSAGNDTGVQNGKCYQYREQLTDNVGNVGLSSASNIAKVDTAAPTNALSLTSVSPAGAAFKSGATVYYRGVQSGGGSFKIRNTVTDGESGPASSQTAALGGSSSGWTHTASTVSTPSGGPYDSNDFTWAQGTTSSPTEVVTGRDVAANATVAGTLTLTNDSNAPTGGALTVNGGSAYDSDGNFAIDTRTDYSETQSATESGLASSTLVRTSASFTSADVCGAFGSPTTLVGTPAQSGLSTACYKYTLTGTDNVGNAVSISTTIKVDTSDPAAPTFSFASVGGGAYYPGSGTRVYFKPSAATGTFDMTASSSDNDSGIASYTFPGGSALGTNWSGSGSGATRTYSYTATATSNGSQSVSATNNAGRSASSSFDLTADSTAPSGGVLTVNGGAAYDSDGNFPIDTRTDYSEGQSATQSGLASSTLVRTSATFSSADVCGSFGSPSTISGNPDQTGLATGCYRYTLTGTDNVGNTVSISTTVKVDTSDPSLPSLSVSNVGGGAYYPGSGTRVYFKPDAANGTFDLAASSSDGDTGIASYTFPAGAALGTNWSATGSGSSRTYSYTATATSNGSQSVSATNNAGRSASSTFDPVADSTAPSGAVLTVNGGAAYDSDGNFPIDTRTDYSEAQSATQSGLASSTLVRTSASFSSPDVCGSFGSPTTITGNPDQTGLATGCYRYTLTGTDNVGNSVSISSTVKVDTSNPSAPSLSLGNTGGAVYYTGSGTRFYFKPDAANGTIDIAASSSDGDTNIASYTFPAGAAIGTNWSVSGSGSARTYSYTATATSNGSQSVSATNNAGRSASSTFDPTADSAASTGGALTVNGGGAYDSDGNFPIDTRTDYSETQSATQSGLASSTLVRTSASFSSPDVCGSFGSPTTITGNPDQTGLATGCYRYTLTGTDNVGNSVSISSTVKVDTSDPSAPTFSFSNFVGTTSAVGNTVFFLPTGSGSFDVTASSSDGDSGVSGYTFPTAASFGSGWSVSGSGATRTYSYSSGAATPGSQTVTAANNAGRTTDASFGVVVSDTTPPTTTIQCNSAACQGSYYSASPVSVTLSADDGPQSSGVNVIRYTIDGSDPTPLNGSDYVAPIDIVATTTVRFRAYDNLGNEEAVGSQLVRVDATAPTGQSISLTGAGAPYYTSASVTFTTGNGSDADSGLDLSTAAVTRETGDLSGDSCSNFTADGGTFSSPDTAVSGAHCYRYSFTIADNVGHVSAPVTATAKVDLDNPSVTLTDPGTPVAGAVSLSASASDASTGITQVVFERSPAGAAIWTTIGTDTSAPYTASWNTGGVADGLYDLRAVATDTVGHTHADVVANRRVDNTAPNTTIDSGPADPSSDTTPTFTVSSSETGSTFECRVDGGSWSSCTSPHTAAALGAGSHTFDVRATDQAGNTDATPASSTWTIDLTAPNTTIDSSPADPSNDTTPTFTFSSNETGSTFECRIDGSSWSSCTSPHTTSALGAGSHTFDVRATDPAGNTDATPASQTWTIDLTDPNTTIDSGPADPSNDSTPTFTFSSNETGSTFECRVDGGSWSSCTSPHTTAALGAGSHTFDVRATDQAGNTDATPASQTWTIDLTDPNTTIDSGPADPSNDATPSFTFSSSETGSTFECRIDGASWSSCTSPHTTAALGAGSHTFDVRATDPAGNTDATPASHTWTIDLAAPNTTIDSSPSDPSGNSTPSFTFSSSEAGSSFECRVDGGSWSSCSSPRTTGSLTDGSHTFDVRATDAAGNTDASPASRTWTVDLTAPQTTIDSSPSSPTNDTTSTFTFSASEPGSTFECRVDGGGWSSCTSPHTTAALAEGTHTFDVRATDPAGNTDGSPASFTWTIDLTAPNTTIDSTPSDPSNDTTPTFAFSASEPGSTFECRIDSGSWSSCSSPHTTPLLGAGSHTLDVRATDQAGNTDGSPATSTWAIDLTDPATSIDSGPADPSNDTTPTFTFSSNETGSTFECRVDGSGWSSCTSPHTTAALGAGSHTFDVRATDQAGNTDGTPASQAWTIDLTDPDTTLNSTPASPANDTTPTFTFSSNESGSTFECRLDGATWSSCTTPHTTAALAEGTHTSEVRATDQAGNTDASPASFTFTIDLTAPNTTIDSGPADPSNDTTPTFDFSATEPGSSYECRVDAGSWSTCTSPHATAALAEGSHTFDVRATDQAGNTDATPASSTWAIDLTAPNTTIDSAPPALDNDATPTFTFSANEPGSTFECRVDSGSWSTCSSPHTTAALSEGSHGFDVRATDQAGNTGTPASHTWSIDLGPPTIAITAPTTYVNSSDPSTYNVTASTPDGDVAHVDFYECSNASVGCATGTWSQFDTDTSAPFSGSWSTPGVDGPRAIRAVALDAALNAGEDVRTITIDRTAPSGVTVSYADGYAFGTVPVTMDNGADADVDASSAVLERQTGDLANDACTNFGGWTAVTSPDTVASGKCAKYRYRVSDDAGNWSTATSSNAVKSDTDAPTSAQDDPGANLRGTVALTSSAGDTGGSGLTSVAFQRRPAGGGSWTMIGADTSSPYSISFDTTTVADGLYDVRTVATDVAGNAETSPSVVSNRRIDNTAPSATMQTPGNPVRATVTLASNTGDGGSGIDTVTYEIAPHNGSFNTQPASWDTTLVADGLYDLRVTATDVAGNSTTSALVTTRVDNTAPALTFSSPVTGDTVSGTVALTATSSDASPASPPVSFFYKLHSDPPSAYTATGASWNTTTLPAGDGLYDLRARTTDDASNTTTVETTSIRVDNVAPSVAITAPAAAINGSLPSPTSFSATAGDPGGSGVQDVQFFECSNGSVDCATGVWSPLGTVPAPGPYSVSWNIPATDGNHALAAVATDYAGHASSDIRNVDVDRTAPDTTITGKPADPSDAATPSFSFGSSEAGSTFECRIDGGGWTPCTSPHSVGGLSDNAHTFDVRATDAAGNTDASPATWTWHRDTTSPTATINNPGANVRQTITLTSAENDPPASGYASGLASVDFEYSADGSTWAPIGTNNSAPFTDMSWNTAAVADGVYQLRVVAHDVAGNVTASMPVTNVRIDNTPPTASQNDPGQYLRATKTLSGSAADGGSGVDHVDFQRAPAGSGSWTTIATATTSPYSVSFDTTAVADGHYDFRAVAYDVAGNQAASTPVADRLVDNTAPSATLNDPGAYLRGAVGLSSSTSDPGGANASGVATVAYEYSTNGGATWQPTGSTFDSTSVADGNVQLHVVATDNAGNTAASAPLTKLVDNTKPNTTDDAPSGWHASDVTVHLAANDATSGVNVTEYSVDGSPTYTVGTSVVVPAPSDGSNDGAHTIAYFSVDNAGNIETVKSATVLIDATPPACPSCSAADYLRGTVTLSASPAADGSGIKSVEFEYSPAGAGTWLPIGTDTTGPAPYTADWDTTPVADGHYDLRIVITDNADNATSSDLPDKVVDNTSPNIALVGAPTEGQIVTGSVGISVTAADATSPVASVEFFVRGSSLGTDATAPFSLNWNTTSGSDGAATIQVVVTDMAGNSTTSAVRNVTVDNVAPTPTLADPGQNLSGTVSLTASSDPDTTQVDFERRPAGGGSWTTIASDSSTPWGTSLDTTTLADGLYDLRAVATDVTGHVGTSALRTNVRVDNTAPSGSITAPATGATVGGTSVALGSSVADGGSGVASVSYELRPTGGGAFTQIASSSSTPFGATWDATTVSTGSYDLRPVITDRAGNTFTGAVVTFAVDVTAPTVTLTNPGATIAGTVTLNATVSGSGATNVAFAATPSGGATWTTLGSDSSAPWSIAYDTTKLGDGVYDLRATVTDNLGNSSQDVVTGVRVDNTAPLLVSSSPADGSVLGSVTAISLVTNEPATPLGVTLDGGATVAPVVSGTHIDYNTGALASGAHTLAGELQDASGKRAPFRVHFTVGSSAPVEKNTTTTAPTTATSSDGFGSVTAPAGSWTTSGADWLVLRIAPAPAPSGLTNGFGPGPEALDVTAYWALAGTQVHEFAQPLEIVIHSSASGLVPATYDGSAWRVIHRVPTGGTLPAGWVDGFFTASDGVHILTKHLSLFALLKDLQAPQAPQNVRGYVGPDGLTIRWLPGGDNSGTYDYVTIFSGSDDAGHYGPDYTAATIAGWKPGDTRIFRLQETDLAGNQSELTAPLQQLPSLIGMTLEQAEAALAAGGFGLGTVTVGGSGKPGTVTDPEGLALAPQGATIDVTVAPGGASMSLVFKVVTAPKLKPTKRTTIAARVLVTRAAQVTAQLISPRHVRLYTWHYKVRAGRTILKLRIPRQVRRPGIYTLRWSARAGRETATRTVRFRLVGARPPAQRIEIVLAGTAAKSVGGILGKQMRTVVTSVDPTFDAAANRNRDVRVIVLDADELGVATVRDLHVVFPSVKIVALAAGPKTMAAALRAGATVVLPRTTPPATLAKIIQRLAKKQ